jgi:uncharacterized protein (TIGR00369 family)
MSATSLARYLNRAKKVTSWFAIKGAKEAVFGHEILNQLKVSETKSGAYYVSTHFDWKTTKAFSNPSDKLHGGAIATLIEYSGAIATLVNDPMGRAPLCINSVIDYNAPCGMDQLVTVEAKVNGISKSTAYTEIILRDNASKKLLAKGSQIMSLGEEKLGIDFAEEEMINP